MSRTGIRATGRVAWAAAAVLLAAAALFAAPTPALAVEAMSFQLETLPAPSGNCGRRCGGATGADVISAEGEINNNTADDFLAFLQSHVSDPQLRPVVMIHSPGGTVVGAMKLGSVFRRIGASVIVARSVEGADQRSHVLPGACMSACVYAFMGGARRIVPSVSRLGIHRMAIYESTHDPAGGSETTRSFGSNDLVSALSEYTRVMGVDPEVIAEAEHISPDSIHIVTPREIARWRLGSTRR